MLIHTDLFGYADKAAVIEASIRAWNPGKTSFWQDSGVPLIVGERQGYVLRDLDGRRLLDVHLNGGTYNLGHRHPELVSTLTSALDRLDIGNHHFPAPARAALAERLLATVADNMSKVVFTTSGSEGVDLAIKSARYATGRHVIVSVHNAYHGHTGLALNTGADRFADLFGSSYPDSYRKVPFNDISAMRAAIAEGDVAGVLLETIPATYGFPLPAPGYLAAVKALCDEFGALYIADEVQTGLMRTGRMWAIDAHDVRPDILVTSKGLGGGLYPIAATVLNESAAGWLHEDGFAHMSTFGGAELGCVVALKVLELTQAPQTVDNVRARIAQFTAGLEDIRAEHSDWLVEIRQSGLVIGLRFDGPDAAKHVMRSLYDHGVWAIFSTLDPRVLQFKPGLLVTEGETETILAALRAAVAETAPSRSTP